MKNLWYIARKDLLENLKDRNSFFLLLLLPMVFWGWASARGSAGFVTFHNLTFPASVPVARVPPSGLYASE